MTSQELLDKINSISQNISMTNGRLQEIERKLLEMGISQEQINVFRNDPNALSAEIEKHKSIINDLVVKRDQIIAEVTPYLGNE